MANRFTDYRVYNMDRREKIKYIILSGLALFGTGYLFFESLPVALLCSLGSYFYTGYQARELCNKRKSELNVQFCDALYSLASSLRAGRSLDSAFRAALSDLRFLYPGETAPIIVEFEYICRRIELNEPVERCLADFAERSGLEAVRNFADVVAICKRSGGNMVQAVRNASHILRDRMEASQEIEMTLVRQRFELKILNIMPFVFIGLLKGAGTGYMSPLYGSVPGYIIMASALLIIITANLLTKKILDIEV